MRLRLSLNFYTNNIHTNKHMVALKRTTTLQKIRSLMGAADFAQDFISDQQYLDVCHLVKLQYEHYRLLMHVKRGNMPLTDTELKTMVKSTLHRMNKQLCRMTVKIRLVGVRKTAS